MGSYRDRYTCLFCFAVTYDGVRRVVAGQPEWICWQCEKVETWDENPPADEADEVSA